MVIGIDCHKATLSACAVDALGAEVSAAVFPNTAVGHLELLGWARALGGVSRIGIEGSGSYGYVLARFLAGAGRGRGRGVVQADQGRARPPAPAREVGCWRCRGDREGCRP